MNTNISRRDYFAANAPDVPDWYELPEPRTGRPEEPASLGFSYSSVHGVPCFAKTDPRYEKVIAHEKAYKKYYSALDKWTAERAMVTIAAWRYVYADAMIAASGQGNPSDAAELERLRKAEDEAAEKMLDTCNGKLSNIWIEARAARIAFEAKIGGGK